MTKLQAEHAQRCLENVITWDKATSDHSKEMASIFRRPLDFNSLKALKVLMRFVYYVWHTQGAKGRQSMTHTGTSTHRD
ncbi:hypothetical protein XELAEV_18004512mg [Xenopus laevis]|uniref:Uncharacterized protein n=1 Tax=Xenopus laevis TaxID=8355 RepID=A0A974GYN8_XENLA|nr:hypothetical protein XELAEV_18004512mg [Xenopus laevis]